MCPGVAVPASGRELPDRPCVRRRGPGYARRANFAHGCGARSLNMLSKWPKLQRSLSGNRVRRLPKRISSRP